MANNTLLTASQVKAAQPRDKGYKLGDAHGLHLFVTPKGLKSWRWRYQRDGVERMMVLGEAGSMTLAQARDRRDDYRRDLREGRDPGGKAVVAASSDTLRQVAQRWHDKRKGAWSGKRQADQVWRKLENHVLSELGDVPIRDIKQARLLDVLERVERSGKIETAERCRRYLVRIWYQAIGEEQADVNPAERLEDSMAPKRATVKRPRYTDIAKLRDVLRDIEARPAHPVVKLAHRFLALTSQRIEEVCSARWADMHGVGGIWMQPTWVIPAEMMKQVGRTEDRQPQAVPLTRQALEVLEAVGKLTGRDAHVFPNLRGDRGHLSQESIRGLMYKIGLKGEHCPHGWRGAFSTIMHKAYRRDEMEIEMMLAHRPKSAVREAYDDNEYLERRGELAQIWADMLMEGARPARDLLELPRKVLVPLFPEFGEAAA